MKLLAGIDFSDATQKVVDQTKTLAELLAAQVWIVHAAEPEPDFVGFDPGPQSERDSRSEKFHEEHRQVQEIADDFRAAGLDATSLLIQGPTIDTLLKEAAKIDADMIIIGSHGKGAMKKLLVGSVSEGVLHKAQCPVLVVPTHDRS